MLASTGIAGILIGGCTIHAWAGIELGEGTAQELIHQVMTRKKAGWCSFKPMKLMLKASGPKRLKLNYEKMFSSFAFRLCFQALLSRFAFKLCFQALISSFDTKLCFQFQRVPQQEGCAQELDAARRPGRAVQVDPIKPALKAPGTKRLKLKYDELLSNLAFKFNLRRYTLVLDEVSMINGELLDKLDAVGRAVRGGGMHGAPHPLPFGGRACKILPGAYTCLLLNAA